MVVLDASHPDILEFIEAKALEEDHGRTLVAAGYPVSEVIPSIAFQACQPQRPATPMSSCAWRWMAATGPCGR